MYESYLHTFINYSKVNFLKTFLIVLVFFINQYLLSEKYIDVDISQQRMYLFSNNKLIKSYPVSTSSFGEGQIENSFKTPLGKHVISELFGTNVDKNEIFVNRVLINSKAKIIDHSIDTDNDFITSRIMWLKGLEDGKNLGGNVDSYNRYIYIHGTQEEGLIGKKASHGCIRMFNHDVIELYGLIKAGTPVNIKL